MSTPSEKERHRKRIRIRSKIARELQDRKYHQRVKEDKKKKLDVSKLSHREFVELLQEKDNEQE